MLHVRHAAAAINEGLCNTVLITHGESGRSRRRRGGFRRRRRSSLHGQFEMPYGPIGPPTMFTIPVLRYLKTYGVTRGAAGDGRGDPARVGGARTRAPVSSDPITVDDVLELADDRLAVPQADVLPGHRRRRRADPDQRRAGQGLPAASRSTSLGTGESVETPMVSQMEDFTSSQGVPRLGQEGVRRGRHQPRRRRPPDDLRRLRAPADLRPGGPGLLQAAARRRRSSTSATPRPAASCRSTPTAAASATCTRACTACTRCRRACGRCAASRRRRCRARRSRSRHGVGGMFAASGTIVMTNQEP